VALAENEMIGKLQRVPLREVWRHEALDFTRWLQDNIDVLNDVVDLPLSNVERERLAGAFSVDLVAEDDAGNPVIIENQLEKSNHDHLGKLITYLTAMGAKAAIWIVADPRPEHVGAIAWLNESSAASFYLVKVEAVRIGESPPAPLLTLIVGPSEESREIGATKKDLAERHLLRHRFWTSLLDIARKQTKLHANISPSHSNWIGTGAGKRGLAFNYVVRQHEANVELYIDRGRDAEEENMAIFDAFMTVKDAIEADFGEPLTWERLEGKRACRIKKRINIGGYRESEERWPEIQHALINAMVCLEKALRPHIAKLPV
jgi:Domain of unknown function (DUF4268)